MKAQQVIIEARKLDWQENECTKQQKKKKKKKERIAVTRKSLLNMTEKETQPFPVLLPVDPFGSQVL